MRPGWEPCRLVYGTDVAWKKRLLENISDYKGQVRTKQVKGLEMPPELLLLMSYMSRQEAKIWWGVRMFDDADYASGNRLRDDIREKVRDFRESYVRAMNLLTGINRFFT
jgi:hypothetical protein